MQKVGVGSSGGNGITQHGRFLWRLSPSMTSPTTRGACRSKRTDQALEWERTKSLLWLGFPSGCLSHILAPRVSDKQPALRTVQGRLALVTHTHIPVL